MKIALLFPGQGSQTVGMGLNLAENFKSAKEVFELADSTLNRDLSGLMFRGNPEDLMQTRQAQPAIMAVGMAVVHVLEQETGHSITDKIAYTAGHSLGEYTALCAAGALSLDTTISLLDKRGEAMARAGDIRPGGMAAVLGLNTEQISDLIRQVSTPEEPLYLANDNCPGQIILSGHKRAIEKAVPVAESMGAKRMLPLAVSGAFHCPYMQPAREEMEPVLKKAPICRAIVPVIANVTAAAQKEPTEIRENLIRQITAPVRWRESVLTLMAQGVDTFIECGNGKVMAGLIRRIAPEATVLSVGDSAGIDQALTLIG